MGDTDIEMGGVEPENPWLPYGIPYPPPLPEKIQLEGQSNEIYPDWTRDAFFYGARDDLWGESFEVRRFNPNDPLGRGKFDKADWNVQYMLGPANPLVYWDPISTKWGLQVLEKAGFMNLEADVRNNASADPKGRFFDKRPSHWRDDLIHPIFRKDMWRNVTDSEWDALRPAILLTSAFLDDPTTLCFFFALSESSFHITFQDPNFKTCKRLRVPFTLTEAEQLSTFRKICAMRQWTSFQLEDNAKMTMGAGPAFGKTFGLKSMASSPYTRQSQVTIIRSYCDALMQYRNKDKNRDYLKFFRSVLWEARVPNSRRPEGLSNNLESAFLRTTFMLANTLLHEFAHAFCYAYFEIPSLGIPGEPWVGDNRDNEFGYAMERHVHGGIPCFNNYDDPKELDVHELRRSTYVPFGIHFTEKWCQWSKPGDVTDMHLVQDFEKDSKSPRVYYPLAQQQIYNFFSTKTWEEDVRRYGLDAVKFTKIKQWAVSRWPGPYSGFPYSKSTLR